MIMKKQQQAIFLTVEKIHHYTIKHVNHVHFMIHFYILTK